MAQMKPPIAPTIRRPATEATSPEVMKRDQVHAALATASTSRIPVLFTVPLRVIRAAASTYDGYPPPTLRNVFSPRAGFEVFIRGIEISISALRGRPILALTGWD